jgi:epoxyqueuosine reductase
MKTQDWIESSEDTFGRLFKNSALSRAKYNGLKKNIDFLIKPRL